MQSLKIIKRTIYAATACCLFFSSCKKMIEIPPNPPDRIADELVFSDSSNAMGAVAGMYTNFNIADGTQFLFLNGGITLYGGLSADELTTTLTDQELIQCSSNAILPNNFKILTMWRDAYKSIYQVNAVLEGVEKSINLSETLKRQLRGEVKVVRALYYFNLVNLFGAVPLVTQTDHTVTAQLPRTSVDKIYEQIIADLQDARLLLTDKYPSAGRARPNLHAATALLAKIYLYRENWQQAADLSDQVIQSGLYTLQTDLSKVFLQGSNESIWQYPSLGSFGQTQEGGSFAPAAANRIPNYLLNPLLANAFEANDKRKTNWVGTNTVNAVNYLYPAKYRNRVNTALTKEDYVIIRLSELYLIHAEALARLDQPGTAVTETNLIRNKAGLTPISFSTKEILLADIMKERRIELFCEWGNRWYDLKRTRTADEVLGPVKPGWQPADVLYPVPFAELQSNPYLTQNPGYN